MKKAYKLLRKNGERITGNKRKKILGLPVLRRGEPTRRSRKTIKITTRIHPVFILWLLLVSIIAIWCLIEQARTIEIKAIDKTEADYCDLDVIDCEIDTENKAKEIITTEITAYCDNINNMANGEKVHKGAVACPRLIPFGTKVNIAGKDYICKDRLHPRFDRRFDIWMPNCSDCWKWGNRILPVKVYK